ncbi:MAG: 50S ribosome-binding GTPase [Acholeplasmatales bacterium]|jgi:ribosome biogenesis GTPase A|nr:50S ribosome-binding GTPase [Acholeplasmatales bacterium]
MLKLCKGCGVLLQDSFKDEPGYTVSLSMDYCFNCFSLLHYGKDNSKREIINNVTISKKSVIFLVVNILEFNYLLQFDYKSVIKGHKTILLINKIDLLPPKTNLDKLSQNILNKLSDENIIDVILLSSLNKSDLDNLASYIISSNYKEISLVGFENSGKTTIFKFLTSDKYSLSINKSGLTKNNVSGYFDDVQVTDTVGLTKVNSVYQYFNYETYKTLIPLHQINPKIYRLKKDETLFVEKLFIITNFHETELSLVFFTNNYIIFHKTNKDKITNNINNELVKGLLIDSTFVDSKFYKTVPDIKYEIMLADVGLLHIQSPFSFTISHNKGLNVQLYEALFK